jgi:hypothetical protein
MPNKNHNLINDVLRVMRGETKVPSPLPPAIADAAKNAAAELQTLRESRLLETRRDILRKHLTTGFEKCNCKPTSEISVQYEEMVDSILRGDPVSEEWSSHNTYRYTPDYSDSGSRHLVQRGMLTPGEQIRDAGIEKTSQGFQAQIRWKTHPTKPKLNNQVIRSGSFRKTEPEALLDLNNLTRHEIHREEVESGKSVSEAKGATKKMSPVEVAFYKWFDRKPVPMLDIPKIYKEIEAAIKSGADLDKVMPDLVKKYHQPY